MKNLRMRSAMVFALIAVLFVSGSAHGKSEAGAGRASSDAAQASVDDYTVGSSVSLRYLSKKRVLFGFVSYQGPGVSPDEAECMNDRKVTLLKLTKVGDTFRERGAGSQHSDYDGYFGWKFRTQAGARGWWSVKVAKRVFSDRYGDLVTCAGATLERKVKI